VTKTRSGARPTLPAGTAVAETNTDAHSGQRVIAIVANKVLLDNMSLVDLCCASARARYPGVAQRTQDHRRAGVLGYFQSQRQNPPRPSARPRATFFARRATRRGLPEAIALMLFEILAAR
jgi:hypothetical protein